MALNIVSDLLVVTSSATPPAPNDGFIAIYIGTDKNLYQVDSNGTATKLNVLVKPT